MIPHWREGALRARTRPRDHARQAQAQFFSCDQADCRRSLPMLSEADPGRARIFWNTFKIWGGIMALPGTFSMLMGGAHFNSNVLLLSGFYYVLAPGVVFGTIGAAALAFLVRPGQRIRALVVGSLVGFGCPAAFFVALALILPKNEGTPVWIFAAMIYGGTGAFAGITAANAIGSRLQSSR